MPVEDIVKNHELLAKVMSHYRHQLEHLHEDAASMSNAMKENLSFSDTIKQIEQILSIKGAKAKEEAKKHAGLLTVAVSQYAKDLEVHFEKAKNLLPDTPDGDLHRLETELEALKAYLTQ
jgi:protein subunit release factor A